MRTTLFLSTLFAVSLVGGVALAERPIDKVMEHRHHGDQLEKTYRVDNARPGVEHNAGVQKVTTQHTQRAHDPGASRINCSGGDADCASSHGRVTSKAHGAPSAQKVGSKNPLQAKFGAKDGGGDADSEACSEGDQCGASSKASKNVWASHGMSAGDSAAAKLRNPMSSPGSASRLLQQKLTVAGSPEDVQDTPSSDASKKIWAMESVKHGTFTGAKDLDVSSQMHKAAARIADQKGIRLSNDKDATRAQTPVDKSSKESDER